MLLLLVLSLQVHILEWRPLELTNLLGLDALLERLVALLFLRQGLQRIVCLFDVHDDLVYQRGLRGLEGQELVE